MRGFPLQEREAAETACDYDPPSGKHPDAMGVRADGRLDRSQNTTHASTVPALREAYGKTCEWPERRMSETEIIENEGFMDLLKLRNLIPSAIAEIEHLQHEVALWKDRFEAERRDAMAAERAYDALTESRVGDR